MDGLMLAGQVGGWQIIIIVLVILLLFGGKKIPELMRGLGQGIAEFKKGMREGDVDQPKKDSAEKKDQ